MKTTLLLSLILLNIAAANAQEPTFSKGKVDIEIIKLHSLNSESKECNLSISPNGTKLYFMSARGGQEWSKLRSSSAREVRYDGDIWLSTKEDGTWKSPICLGDEVNTYSGEDEPMISETGRSIAYQSWKSNWKFTGGPYYEASLSGKRFSHVKGLGGGINKFFVKKAKKNYTSFATDGASMSRDGQTFVVCCGPTYAGKMDIYISRKVKGKWSKMKKLPISTAGDERSVYISHDGKTLYFASDGYGGLGGLDIYKTVMDDKGNFGEVINIGSPFNTPMNDRDFIISNDGDESYFVRNGDIYYANIEKVDSKLKPSHLEKITDELTVSSRTVKIIYWDNSQEDGDIVSIKINGEYILTNQVLTKKRRELNVVLTREINDIVLLAENTGNSPANTASLIVDDGTTRHRIRMRSDMGTSATLRITVVEAP